MTGQFFALQKPPVFYPGLMLLLTDATVMCQASGSSSWWRLTPDPTGSYSNGTWSRLADSPTSPLWFASAVLRDGRVFFAGGEYSDDIKTDLNTAAIYDPVANTWTSINGPVGWTALGDLVNCVLPDGRVLIGAIDSPACAIYDPDTNGWKPAADKNNDSSNEETWTLLPDRTVLTVNCDGPKGTQRYLIDKDFWIDCGETPFDLVEKASKEIGPALLMPDGRCFCIGATGRTAWYTPPHVATDQGMWTDGPVLPMADRRPLGAKDAPACLMPNGKILMALGPLDGTKDNYLGPTYIYEWDPAQPFPTDPISVQGDDPCEKKRVAPCSWIMLPLPSGEILLSNNAINGASSMLIYHPDGAALAAGKPKIIGLPVNKAEKAVLAQGGTFTITGTLFNGISQAASYGDDASMATNYPIVRLESKAGPAVWYCRTFGHSSMGVAVREVVSTNFTVPWDVPLGDYDLRVIANGIASEASLVTVGKVEN